MKYLRALIFTIFITALTAPSAMADTFITKDGTGTYVGGLPGILDNEAYVEWTPSTTPEGFYIDGAPKKKYAYKKYTEKHKFPKN